jgi:hypothetical protein
MNSTISLLSLIAPYFSPYLELVRLTGELYYFRKASTSLRDDSGNKRFWHPRIEHRMLRDLHKKSDEILYIALPAIAKHDSLTPYDLLYIGCSVGGGSRFWRGRQTETQKFPSSYSCFHHEPMRRGRGGHSLETFLGEGNQVRIHTLTSKDVEIIQRKFALALPVGKYPAHQLEKRILAEGFTNWRWNARS